jgi:hypothetical protein
MRTASRPATIKKLNAAIDAATRNARQAGYTLSAIARIISTPSDVLARR